MGTNTHEAFELVTEALEDLDRYQMAAKSEQAELLTQADTRLRDALNKDPGYFKAKYYLAMVNYLSTSKIGPGDPSPAAQFNELQNEESLAASVKREIHYNRGAALYQEGNYPDAIAEFQNARSGSASTPELDLLTNAGLALAHARRAKEDAEQREKDLEEVYRLCDAMKDELRKPPLFKRLLALLRGRPPDKQIDEQVARRVDDIIEKAYLYAVAAKMSSTRRAEPPKPPSGFSAQGNGEEPEEGPLSTVE